METESRECNPVVVEKEKRLQRIIEVSDNFNVRLNLCFQSSFEKHKDDIELFKRTVDGCTKDTERETMRDYLAIGQ